MSKTFVRAARLADIRPGRMQCTRLNGQRILLANVNGTLYATDELCTHEDHTLCNGALHGELVSCSLHGSRFNVRTGEPQEEPARVSLRTYPVRIDGDDILVKI